MSEEANSKDENKKKYSADSIQALEGMEHVRMRPSMYIGDVGVRGLHHLVYEVVDNSIDEAMGGYCDKISVIINEDNSITCQDNGRGIPVDLHKKEGISALEVVMTKIGAGGKFDKDSYKVSGGLHGVGVSCVNALSNHLKATVHRDGKVWEQEYERGKSLYPVKSVGETNETGTIVTFIPDDTIFTQTTEYSYETLSNRMRAVFQSSSVLPRFSSPAMRWISAPPACQLAFSPAFWTSPTARRIFVGTCSDCSK